MSVSDISLRDGEFLVRLARRSVEYFLDRGEIYEPEESSVPEGLRRNMGAFVSIYRVGGGGKELRGCIGVPYPVYPLWYAVIYSSVSASFKDPRFPPLSLEELNKVVWELSVLTEPQEISKERLPEGICIGRDGLIVELGSSRGLLLPQVAPRYSWDPVEFLEHTCLKAGLERDCWKDPSAKVYIFESEIFEEVEPWGEVKKVEQKTCG